MKGAPFRAIGGAIHADHGPLTLAQARDLAQFYHREAMRSPAAIAVVCRARARALNRAVAASFAWRRAAGWSDPFAADAADLR